MLSNLKSVGRSLHRTKTGNELNSITQLDNLDKGLENVFPSSRRHTLENGHSLSEMRRASGWFPMNIAIPPSLVAYSRRFERSNRKDDNLEIN